MTKEFIVKTSRRIFAEKGYDGLTMRALATELGCAPSVLYHHFENKDTILEAMFETTTRSLGNERRKLATPSSASEMLKQRIVFQFDHAEEVVAILKYYFQYRELFSQKSEKILPAAAYSHMLEVIQKGQDTGEFLVGDSPSAARVFTHAVNGFVLEYYPVSLSESEKEELATTISQLLLKSLRPA